MNSWYVLHTKPHKERLVAYQLRAGKLNVYLPLVRVNPANPRAARERPYFPNYLFVNVDLDAVGLSAIQWAPGMRRIVQFGRQPAIVPDNLIVELKRRLQEIRAAGGLVFHELDPGDRVRIVNGPFGGYEGIFDARLAGSERVRVLLELLEQSGDYRQNQREVGRSIRLELNAGDIVKVKRKRRRGRRRH